MSRQSGFSSELMTAMLFLRQMSCWMLLVSVEHLHGLLPVELELVEELVEGLELPAVGREDLLAGALVHAVEQRQLQDLGHAR